MAEKTDEQRARELATQDLEDIQTLRGTPAFERYFERRVNGMVATKADAVLHDLKLTPETLWRARLEYLAMRDVALLLTQDEGACRRLLSEGADA